MVDAGAGDRLDQVADELRAAGAEVRLGDATTAVDCDLVVTSPGWRPDQPLLADAARRGIEVIGEPELAWRLRPPGAADWLGVTGTNGKTTTVGMLASILVRGRFAHGGGRQRGAAADRRGPRHPGVRRSRRRAVELPAALVVVAAVLGCQCPQRRGRSQRLARLGGGLRGGQGPDPARRCPRDREPRRRRLDPGQRLVDAAGSGSRSANPRRGSTACAARS